MGARKSSAVLEDADSEEEVVITPQPRGGKKQEQEAVKPRGRLKKGSQEVAAIGRSVRPR